MIRSIETHCTAQIISGDAHCGSIFACGNQGECLKDKRRAVGQVGAAVLIGECAADKRDGVTDPVTAQATIDAIRANPQAVGMNMMLDIILGTEK